MSHCGALSWRGIQTKSWTCNVVSFWIQFNNRTQVLHLREGKQDGHITCLKLINLSRTWWCCWKVDNATLHAGFCLPVGEHERFVTTAEFRRNAVIPCMLLESFDCRSRSTRQCAAEIQNNVCWMFSRFNGVATIHAVRAFEQNDPASGVQESSDSQAWPYPSSLHVSETESPD